MTAKSAREITAKYEKIKQKTHTKTVVWIENEILEQVRAVAHENGWVHSGGRRDGQVKVEYSINAVLKAGAALTANLGEMK